MNDKTSMLVIILAGISLGSYMLWIGFQNNNQGEFFDVTTGKVDYLYSFAIFMTWFLTGAFFASLLFWIIRRRNHSAK